jgi:N-acetylglucosaminyldiphosphoundecaprenol N-acetyl-beta-D-mannosaminyltransferase
MQVDGAGGRARGIGMHPFPTTNIGGIPFSETDLESATDWLQHAASTAQPISVRLANAFCVATADADKDYRAVLAESGVNFPDGTPVVWFMRIRRRRGARISSASRVRGPSFFSRSLEKSETSENAHFFLGSTHSTLEMLVSRVHAKHPDLQIAGYYSPPFAAVDDAFIEDCAAMVRKAGPVSVVWIGLGSPKQDYVSTRLAAALGVPCVGVGAAFDYSALTVKEAPAWVQNSGLEWLFRFAAEPRRLWRRYLLGNLRFLVAVFRPRNWLNP